MENHRPLKKRNGKAKNGKSRDKKWRPVAALRAANPKRAPLMSRVNNRKRAKIHKVWEGEGELESRKERNPAQHKTQKRIASGVQKGVLLVQGQYRSCPFLRTSRLQKRSPQNTGLVGEAREEKTKTGRAKLTEEGGGETMRCRCLASERGGENRDGGT